ncbi:G-protein-signaling modulator 2-like [Montipora foliosa]|uniref:G-protein-signaling modulator 2-like n=1 Tax=Montipora foliosa TaxID=591990 RepID=UPI0035F127B5
MGYFKQAIENHEKNLSIAKEVGDRAGEGEAFRNLGNAFHILGTFEQATEYYQKYLGIAKEVGDRAGEGSAYGSLGIAYHTLGNFQQAIEYFKQQLSITKEVGDRVAEGTGHGNLANAYQSLGDFRRAIEYSKQHLSIAKEVGDRAGEGNACGNLGNAYGCLGNFRQAIEYIVLVIKHLDEARHNLKSEDEWKIRFRDSHRVSYTALWRTLLKSGEIEEALYAAEKGRAQALVDILREQYGIDSQSFCPLTPKQTPSAALELLHSQAVFVALDNNKITFWVIRKDSEIRFRQGEIVNGSADMLMELR